MRIEETIGQCAETLSALGCVKSAEELSVLANLLALTISKGKNTNQLNVVGNFIVSVGGLILTIAAQIQACAPTQQTAGQPQDLSSQIQDLKKRVHDLETNPRV